MLSEKASNPQMFDTRETNPLYLASGLQGHNEIGRDENKRSVKDYFSSICTSTRIISHMPNLADKVVTEPLPMLKNFNLKIIEGRAKALD